MPSAASRSAHAGSRPPAPLPAPDEVEHLAHLGGRHRVAVAGPVRGLVVLVAAISAGSPFLSGVVPERARGCELTQLVADHRSVT